MWTYKDYKIYVSDKPKKKYFAIKDGTNKRIYFGDSSMQQYYDKFGKYSFLNHNDENRLKRYKSRAKAIKDKYGRLTYNNPDSPNFWSYHFLW